MHIVAQSYAVAKDGRHFKDIEDAHWPTDPIDLFALSFRAVVADGAPGTFSSGLWSALWCREGCCSGLPQHRLRRIATRLRKKWRDLAKPTGPCWWQQDAFQQGAHCAFMGISLREANVLEHGDGFWSAFGLGDCSLFHVRDGCLVTSVPYQDWREYRKRPVEVGSSTAHGNDWIRHLVRLSGRWHGGDIFFLTSDALGCWLLRQAQARNAPWQQLLQFDSNGNSFHHWVQDKRAAGDLENDDVTMLRICVYA